jgi:thiol-disulfide isomerase/thioredoxin
VLVDRELRVYESYEAAGTPSAVLISPAGRIASPLAAGAGAIEELLERALAGEFDAGGRAEEGLALGGQAPELRLPVLGGGHLRFDELRGEETLLLFWNPDCGFCQAMRDELRALEREAGREGPRLVVVSSGDEEATRADGFRSTVLLDPAFAAGEAFGAGGTPMAVLLDAEARVASPVAGGAEAVLELLRAEVRAAS